MDVTTTNTQGTSVNSVPNTAPETDNALNSDFETFLVMLTTQLQNQDPLNPMESAEFAMQLATFSGVEQQVKTNDLLTAISHASGSGSLSEYASWVGMEARSSAPAEFNGSPISLFTEIAPDADQAKLVVKNETGTVLQRSGIALDTTDLSWAGVLESGAPMPYGTYSFSVESYKGGALISSAAAQSYTEVTEARLENGSTLLRLAGGEEIDVGEVTALRQP